MSEPKEVLKFHQDVESLFTGPDPDAQFKANLRSHLLKRAVQPRKNQRLVQRPVWMALTVILVAILVITLILGPQKVLAAVQGWLGYIPGAGFVAEGAPLRTLSEPVSQERDGVTVTLEQVLADSQQTTLLFRVNGLSVQKANVLGEDISTGSIPELVLPDGSHLKLKDSSGDGWGTGYETRLYFEPMSQGVEQAVLLIPVLQGYSQGVGPENWQIPFKLVKAAGEVTLMPVQVIEPTATAESATQAVPALMELRLTRTVELGDSYILQGVYAWNAAKYNSLSVAPDDIEVTDANGNLLAQEYPFGVQDVDYNMANEQPWATKVLDKTAPGPWTVTVRHAYTDRRYELPFTVDFGNAPQTGQTWQIGQTFDLDGHSLTVISATLTGQGDGSFAVVFNIQGDDGLQSVSVYDPTRSSFGSGPGAGGELGNLSATVNFDMLPAGRHEFQVSSAYLRLDGAWSVSWQPTDNTDGQPLVTQPAQSACLNNEVWQQLQSEPGLIPDGLGGKLLVYAKPEGESEYAVYLMNLDGSERQKLTNWPMANLSPDGKILAFADDAGVVLQNLQTGDKTRVSGSGSTDWRPIWSPDGKWLAYNHGQGDVQIAIASADGSQNRILSSDTSNRNAVSWWPDSSRIVYTDFIDTGAMIFNSIDLNGQVSSLFIAGEGMKYSNPAVSGSTSQMAYETRVAGSMNYGVYLSSLDGMSKTLLAQIDDFVVNSPLWSKDGNWVLLNVTDSVNEHNVLINPETCQVLRLAGVSGKVLSWSAQ